MHEKKKECYYAKEREFRSAFYGKRSLIIFRYKEISLNLTGLNFFLPSCIISLLHDFYDAFSKEMPKGLPPLWGIEHQIDLILNSTILNQLVYKNNPDEIKELQRQVSC